MVGAIRRGALALVALGGAACGCGGGSSSQSVTTATSAATTTVPVTTTTTIVTLEAYTASICAAGFSIADVNPGRAEGFKLNAETFGKVVASPDKKADLDAYVEANRALGLLWSDPTPTTPEAFIEQNNKLVDTSDSARERVGVECPPRPGVTTTVAAAVKAAGRVYSVFRHDQRKGLWWAANFGCPEGKKVKLGADLTAVTGEPTAGAVLDEAAGAADPFTGILANESFGRVAEKIKATCV